MGFQGFTAAEATLDGVALAGFYDFAKFVELGWSFFDVFDSDEVMFAVALGGCVAFGEVHLNLNQVVCSREQ